jgi:hypothetical protein
VLLRVLQTIVYCAYNHANYAAFVESGGSVLDEISGRGTAAAIAVCSPIGLLALVTYIAASLTAGSAMPWQLAVLCGLLVLGAAATMCLLFLVSMFV